MHTHSLKPEHGIPIRVYSGLGLIKSLLVSCSGACCILYEGFRCSSGIVILKHQDKDIKEELMKFLKWSSSPWCPLTLNPADGVQPKWNSSGWCVSVIGLVLIRCFFELLVCYCRWWICMLVCGGDLLNESPGRVCDCVRVSVCACLPVRFTSGCITQLCLCQPEQCQLSITHQTEEILWLISIFSFIQADVWFNLDPH